MTTKKETGERLYWMKWYGLDTDDYEEWRTKWQNLKKSAARTGKPFDLSFKHYIHMAHQANITKPAQIGMKADQFQMGRIGDEGGYTLGNCRFITMRQNIAERDQNDKRVKKGVRKVTVANDGLFTLVTPDRRVFKGKTLDEIVKAIV